MNWFTIIFVFCLIFGCSKKNTYEDGIVDTSSHASHYSEHDDMFANASPATYSQVVSFEVSAPISNGSLEIFTAIGDEVRQLNDIPFYRSPIQYSVRYDVPEEKRNSFVLFYIYDNANDLPSPKEYLCFVYVEVDVSSRNNKIKCDDYSTVSYFLAGADTLANSSSVFQVPNLNDRLLKWKSITESRGDPLPTVLNGIVGTVWTSLLSMADGDYSPNQISSLKLLESLAVFTKNQYQRNANLYASELVEEASRLTGNRYPIRRIVLYKDIYSVYVQHEVFNTDHGRLNLLGSNPLLIQSSYKNIMYYFFVDNIPLLMTDDITHKVQNVKFELLDEKIQLQWQHLPHMRGYNIYSNGIQIQYTSYPGAAIDKINTEITIKAVGSTGEFPPVRLNPSDIRDLHLAEQ